MISGIPSKGAKPSYSQIDPIKSDDEPDRPKQCPFLKFASVQAALLCQNRVRQEKANLSINHASVHASRKLDRDRGAFLMDALELHRPAEPFGSVFDNRQPEPGASLWTCSGS